MDSTTFQQLLELESNLSKAQQFLNTSNQTALLLSHLENLNNHSTAHTGFDGVEIKDIESLLQQTGSFDLAISCSSCNQLIYENDECAKNQIHKDNLQPCCMKMLKNLKQDDELEITFWWFFINNFSNCILTLPNYTRFMLTNGIPTSLRDRIWGLLTFSNNSKGENDEYLLNLYESLNKDISPDIRIITKDVNRTYPQLSMFTEFETKSKFEKILNAYSIFDSDMGYCQGLQFIVAPMLFHFDKDDFKTFNSLVKFFEINKLRNIYDNQMSGLNLWFYQFEEIFKHELPELSTYLIDTLNVDLKVFLSQWFLSFYSITIPFNFLIRVFDIMFLEGVKETLLRVGIVILSKNSKLLQSIDESELVYQHLLSENCWGVFQNNVDSFINEIMNLNIEQYTEENLQQLSTNYSQSTTKEEQDISPNSFISKMFTNLKYNAESILSSPIDSISSSKSSLFSINSESESSNTSIFESDFDLVESLYKMCLEKGLDGPILDKVKDRLYQTTTST
ncbi:hypothetical protein WICANDRAFT_76617 [Wickerhamomyces anomalus NRRL Y-366-8]|uniref:Rab-GAP TBC domain-containing protein n=1 Tax=Wickerhamomyces anomalus (strain ATCC 58044 / CBS 1984 / NCYC 433 / NRRL Y-366-8) TaxID=683960 RepID=A0A1E3PAK0_WICAA|nr:uncharacterized protein WICANDRAFT_76617 [Wickerhamomyces anomalus NRRL Y-366-8]ODQ62449.1 hypothetical protein WICANDRAFT_76617 [Wickerhamomyces anomalus NRRL Y-366-8]